MNIEIIKMKEPGKVLWYLRVLIEMLLLMKAALELYKLLSGLVI